MPDYTDNEPPVTYEQVWADMARQEQVVYRRDLFFAHALTGLATCPEFEALRTAEECSREFVQARRDLAYRAASVGAEMEDQAWYYDKEFQARVTEEFERRQAGEPKKATRDAEADLARAAAFRAAEASRPEND